MSNIDIAELKRNADIIQVISNYGVTFKKAGKSWKANCPFHTEDSASFVITAGRKATYKCFGCGVSGDVIDFVMNYGGRTFQQAIQEISDPTNVSALLPGGFHQESQKAKAIEWRPITPRAPFKTPSTDHYQFGKASKVWYYKNAEGHPVCLVCRFDLPGGEKQVWPLTYCVNEQGREEWRWKGLIPPRPLYKLDILKIRPTDPVMIGEGEKTADAMHDLFNRHTCTTWIGGVGGLMNTDFSPLYGRSILLWADNDKEKKYKHGPQKGEIMPWWDQPGNKAMLKIAELLKDHCPTIEWVQNAPEFPCGWDVADSTWTPEEAEIYLKDNTIPVPPVIIVPVDKTPPPPDVTQDGIIIELPVVNQTDVPTIENNDNLPPTEAGDPRPKGMKDGGFFRMLGYQKDVNTNLYHFYSYKSKSVISLSPSAMTKPNLLQLAPMAWWEGYYPRKNKEGMRIGGFELDKAQDWLIDKSVTRKVFNHRLIRGRGAWMDGKHIVVHTGEKLIVDGVPTEFENFHSKYIYEIGEDMDLKMPPPLSTKQSSTLIEILNLVNWERGVDAYLLAGWCVVAPVCGALPWRPHFWLTGGSGTGKSWIFQYLVRRLLGETALAVQGETSEAGLRQTLKHDALPVLFDEAEGEDKKSQDRMADVIGLMRSASASDGGSMLKGSSFGRANTYRTRSCFGFASIAFQIIHQSDRTRVSVLSLKKIPESKEKKQRWEALQKKYNDTITEDYAARLRARTITMLPTILKNAETFSNAAAAELGQQRAGDQIGVLLAGAYSLRSSKKVTYEDALTWIKAQDWNEEKSHDLTRDELALIQHLLAQNTRIESSHGIQERNIGELVRITMGVHSDKDVDIDKAHDRLRRIGMKVKGLYLVIGNGVDALNRMLAGTHWAKNYHKILMRLEGAMDSEPTRFASGVKIRAIKIPTKLLFMNDQGSFFDPDENKIPITGTGIYTAEKKENYDDTDGMPF